MAVLGAFITQTVSAGEVVPDWTQISTIFNDRCIMCHSAAAAERGLRLDSYDGVIAGSENGPVIIPGDPQSSELVRRLNGSSSPRMPFLSRPLADETIALIERWVASGMPEVVPPTPNAAPD
jgi:uncharacterized membrane protein